jgi:hypothetical protein
MIQTGSAAKREIDSSIDKHYQEVGPGTLQPMVAPTSRGIPTESSFSSTGYPIPWVQNEDRQPTTNLLQKDVERVDRIVYK